MQEIILKSLRQETKNLLWRGTGRTPRQVRFRLVEEGAELDLRGAFFTRKKEQLLLRIEVVHEAPNTKSNVILRGLVEDQAYAEVHAFAIIKKGARGAQTHVEAKALLRSEHARAKLEPYLEIDEDDVRVTHSASVKPLEEEEIFYLMSRGLSRDSAEKLLLESFFAPVKAALYQANVRIGSEYTNSLIRKDS